MGGRSRRRRGDGTNPLFGTLSFLVLPAPAHARARKQEQEQELWATHTTSRIMDIVNMDTAQICILCFNLCVCVCFVFPDTIHRDVPPKQLTSNRAVGHLPMYFLPFAPSIPLIRLLQMKTSLESLRSMYLFVTFSTRTSHKDLDIHKKPPQVHMTLLSSTAKWDLEGP